MAEIRSTAMVTDAAPGIGRAMVRALLAAAIPVPPWRIELTVSLSASVW